MEHTNKKRVKAFGSRPAESAALESLEANLGLLELAECLTLMLKKKLKINLY